MDTRKNKSLYFTVPAIGYLDLKEIKEDQYIKDYSLEKKINLDGIYNALFKLRDYINDNINSLTHYESWDNTYDMIFTSLSVQISTEFTKSCNIYTLYERYKYLYLMPVLNSGELCSLSESPDFDHIRKCPICYIKHKLPENQLGNKTYDNYWHNFKNESRDYFTWVVCYKLHELLDPLIAHVVDLYFKYVVKIKKSKNIKVIFE
jgi:hypothetical protein